MASVVSEKKRKRATKPKATKQVAEPSFKILAPSSTPTKGQRFFGMSEAIRDDLEEDLAFIAAVKRGEIGPDSDAVIEMDFSVPSPAALRERLGVSQDGFARLLGISIRTLQCWEQGSRQPTGPARTLLRIVDKDPSVLLKAWRK